jgi:hypothetical protein
MQTFVATVRKMMDKNMSKFLTDFTKELSPTSTLPTNTVKLYNTAVNYTNKLWPIFMSALHPRLASPLVRLRSNAGP